MLPALAQHPLAASPTTTIEEKEEEEEEEESTKRNLTLAAPANVLNAQLDRLWRMLTEHDGQLADVWIYTVDYPSASPSILPAHKCILAAGCPALISRLDTRRNSSSTSADSSSEENDDGFKSPFETENSSGVSYLDLRDVASTWAVRAVLRYVYGQSVDVAAERLSELCEVAKDMQCRGLERECKQKLFDLRTEVTLDGKLGARKDILDVGTRQRAPKSDQDISSVVTKSSVDAVPSASSILDTQKAVSEEDATVGEKESCELSGAVTEEALKGDAHLKKDANSASTSSFLDMIRNSGSLPQLDRGRMIVSPGAFDKKYELISPEEGGILGEGMNGAVRLARDRFTGEKVAVKTLSLVNLSPVKREMLYDEINIYLPLSHPNIVRLNEVYEEPGEKIILVMEACTGGELYERLAKLNRYSERDAAKIIRHILYAVSYLHSLNICHRDIKLENFVYTDDTEDSKLKLCDFGFGTIVRQGPNGATPLTAAMGSVHYVAPEVLEGKYGLQCDMWSVGVILYMLLSGTPPFDGADDREVTEAVRHAPLKLTGSRWDCISYSAKDLVSKLLCRDPYKRLTATQALQHEWCGSTDILKLNTAPNEIDVDVLKSMHTFTRCSAIQRAALGLIAQKRSDEVSGLHDRLKLMEETFKRMDVNNDGVITLAEFEDAVRRHVAMDEHEAEKIFGEISSCSSVSSEAEPVIHYRDFLAATIHSLRNRQPGKHNSHHHESGTCPREESSTEWRWNPGDVRSAFEAFDMERKGYVTKENLLTVLACDVTEVDRILKAAGFDPTKTDRIDFDDFSKLLHCREISIMEFAREDSESEEDNKVSRSVVEAARFAEEDEYEESLLGDSEGGSTNGTPRNGVMTLRPSRMPSLEKWAMEETEEPVQRFLRRMRTWPVFYPIYGFMSSYEDYDL